MKAREINVKNHAVVCLGLLDIVISHTVNCPQGNNNIALQSIFNRLTDNYNL